MQSYEQRPDRDDRHDPLRDSKCQGHGVALPFASLRSATASPTGERQRGEHQDFGAWLRDDKRVDLSGASTNPIACFSVGKIPNAGVSLVKKEVRAVDVVVKVKIA